MSSRSTDTLQSQLLDATERLIYSDGIHATGMDAIVKASGVARKTLYRYYPNKEALIVAALERRDERWMQWFIQATSAHDDPAERLLSVFPALRSWFESESFHGCAFLNAAGETGDPSSAIRRVSRMHKERLRSYLAELAGAANYRDPASLASQLLLLVDGAISVALVFGTADAADQAADVARLLLSTRTTT
jgi:AcrR family transcriptional regulator